MSNLGRRGEVWFAEIKGKRRPVLIVSHHNVVVRIGQSDCKYYKSTATKQI